MKKTLIVALHGFLGEPSDWNFLRELGGDVEICAPSLWQESEIDAKHELSRWPEQFQSFLKKKNWDQYENRVLCGYSMGGRLGAHHLVRFPEVWTSALLISMNPGLTTPEEKIFRVQNDRAWADRFLRWQWSDVLKEWNSQGVFQGGQVEPERKEENFHREKLAGAFTQWSLGKQENLREALEKCPVPITYITGTDDFKFTQIMKKWASENQNLNLKISPTSGHRVIFDNPNFIKSQL